MEKTKLTDGILQYTTEVGIDNRLIAPAGCYFDTELSTIRITYFTLKELQELYYNSASHKNYNINFFKSINNFFEKNMQYKTSKQDILLCINSFGVENAYYSIGVIDTLDLL